MPDYQRTQIYALTCDSEVEFLYIGHTTDWHMRENAHESCTRNESNRKLYRKIRELGWENINVEFVEDFPCNNRREAEIREQYWMDMLGATQSANSCRSYVATDQREELKKETFKKWSENNKEHKKEYDKKYYEENKERKKEYNKEYRETKKEHLDEKRLKKFNCECGGKYIHCHKSTHLKSKRHQLWLGNNTFKSQ